MSRVAGEVLGRAAASRTCAEINGFVEVMSCDEFVRDNSCSVIVRDTAGVAADDST